MSAALLFFRRTRPLTDVDRARFEAVASSMAGRILEQRQRTVETRDAIVRVWSRVAEPAPALHVDGDRWLAFVGNPTRPDLSALTSEAAASQLFEERGAGSSNAPSPPFAIASHEGSGRYRVEVDRSGLEQLYVRDDDPEELWVASSSLALGTARPTDVDVSALAEWLSVGHFLSERTLFHGIRKLGPGELITISADESRTGAPWRPVPGEFRGDPTDAYVGALERSVRTHHAADTVALELTGGLDTRVLLAVHIATGLPIHAWTIGQDGCDELRAIDRLRARFAFDHSPVRVDASFAGELPELVPSFHELSDGEVSALEYSPLLFAFEQGVAERRDVSITGGGAELARGFYFGVLGSAGRSLRGVPIEALQKKVTRYTDGVSGLLHPELCAAPETESTRVIEEFVAGSAAQTPGTILEDFYLRTRMQRFAGRNTTTTGLFYRQGAPFFDNDLVDLVFSLPHESKRGAHVVRGAIEQLCPPLARLPLDTGMPVRSVSWRRPRTQVAQAMSFGRRGLVKFGGRAGAAIARRPPPPVPWNAAVESRAFRDFVFDLLNGADARVNSFCDPRGVQARLHAAFETSTLYPIGLLLTFELTLRRLELLRRTPLATPSRSASRV